MTKRIGLFFGSFNPVHIGHLIIADYMLEAAKLAEVWFVVSPQNPHKKAEDLLHEFDRYDMLSQAISDNPKFRVSDVEFRMPKPSYTIDTLDLLTSQHSDKNFSLIIGEDNLEHFDKWKDYHRILDGYQLLVYPRPGQRRVSAVSTHPSVLALQAPLIDLSATMIRKRLKAGESVRYMLPEGLEAYIHLKKHYL